MRMKISAWAMTLLVMGPLSVFGQSSSSTSAPNTSNSSKSESSKKDEYKKANSAEISSQIHKGIDAQGGTQFKSVPPVHDSPLSSKPDKKTKY